MSELVARVDAVRRRIARACERAGRAPGSVRLVAVAKTFPARCVADATAAGLTEFGENRVQEAAAKIPAVRALCGDAALRWHLVGQLQRNKARRAIELFDEIHSVDRIELGVALSRAASELGRRPRLLLQVNIDEEAQKGGVAPKEAGALLAELERLPAVEVVGLMAVPREVDDPERARPAFARLRALAAELDAHRDERPPLRELSIGMSADFEVAIEEGATLVRVGSAIFGERSSA